MKFLYYLLMTVCYPISLLPFWVHYLFADVLYLLIYYVGRYRVKVVRKNLRSAFPEKSEKELRHIEKDFYQWFCDYIVESMKLLTVSDKNIKRRMVFKGTEQIEQCVAEGLSIGVYLGHYCNWEWITSLQLWVGKDIACGQIYHPLENEAFDKLFLYLRNRLGAKCIPMEESIRKIVKMRQEGKPIVIGYIADQVPHWNSIHYFTEFLHHDTPVLTGTERIVRKMNHAVY